MHPIFPLAALTAALPVVALAAVPENPSLEVVPHVDLNQYLGTWYEIATIPQRFQKGCVAVTATYTLRPDGDIKVLNKCRKNTLDGPVKTATAKAWVVDKTSNAKLKVRFFWPFTGDYWIIDLDPAYRWAVVGAPNRNYLWILCRSPRMDDRLYEDIVGRAAAKGFDVKRLVKTLQPDA